MTGNTMAKRMTGNTMAKRKTGNTMAKRMTGNTRKVKNLTYTSLVCPVVDYSSPVWNPFKKKQQIFQVERIQRKAARCVFNDYRDRSPGSVTNMIDTFQ
jgi:hypothetical protein